MINSTNNLKVLAKSVLALSKIGDEVYFEPLEKCVSVKRRVVEDFLYIASYHVVTYVCFVLMCSSRCAR